MVITIIASTQAILGLLATQDKIPGCSVGVIIMEVI